MLSTAMNFPIKVSLSTRLGWIRVEEALMNSHSPFVTVKTTKWSRTLSEAG